MTLADAKTGNRVVIRKINGDGAIKKRLLEMGILKNVEMRIERYAPLMDPIQVSVKGYSLALRVSEGRMIDINVA
jgi:ferrous iron transport protein A